MGDVYDEEFRVVELIQSNKKVDSKTKTVSQRKQTRRRGEEYISDAKKRSDARYKRRNGLINAMHLLSLTTKDNVYIEITHYKTKEVKRYSTNWQDLY